MDPVDALLATLIVLHVAEGLFWVRRSAVVIARSFGGSKRVSTGGPLGDAQHVFVLLDPWPPLFERYIVESWPFCATDGALWRVPAELPIGARTAPAAPEPITWDTLREATVSGRVVVTKERTVAETSSVAFATHLCEVVRDVAAAEPERRTERIRAWLDRAFDRQAAFERLEQVRSQTRFLQVLSNVTPWMLIGGVAAVFYVPAVAVRWPAVAAFAAAIFFFVWVDMFRAHRELYPELGRKRWADLGLMILSLPATARAHGWIARDALAGFHPLVAAAVLLPREAFEAYASEVWRSLEHPLPSAGRAIEPTAWTRAELRERVAALLASMDIDPAAYDAAPTPSSDRVVGFCPRCRAEFERRDDECPDCPGVALRAIGA